MNLGYRFRRDRLEQVDGSVAWPVSKQWSLYARMVYSLEDDALDDRPDRLARPAVDDKGVIDQFAGLEYRSCCWRFRVVAPPLRERPHRRPGHQRAVPART